MRSTERDTKELAAAEATDDNPRERLVKGERLKSAQVLRGRERGSGKERKKERERERLEEG